MSVSAVGPNHAMGAMEGERPPVALSERLPEREKDASDKEGKESSDLQKEAPALLIAPFVAPSRYVKPPALAGGERLLQVVVSKEGSTSTRGPERAVNTEQGDRRAASAPSNADADVALSGPDTAQRAEPREPMLVSAPDRQPPAVESPEQQVEPRAIPELNGWKPAAITASHPAPPSASTVQSGTAEPAVPAGPRAAAAMVSAATAPVPRVGTEITYSFHTWGEGHQVTALLAPSGTTLMPSSPRVEVALQVAAAERVVAEQWRVERQDGERERDTRQSTWWDEEHD